MAVIKTTIAPQFKGEDVVLCAMDGPGLALFHNAIKTINDGKIKSFPVMLGNEYHQFHVEGAGIVIECGEAKVKWQLENAMLPELLSKIAELEKCDRPCHQYIDIKGPMSTLVLSKNEYV